MLILKKYAIRAFIFAAILLVFVVGQARAQGEATSDQSNCNGAGQVRVDGVCRQVYTAVQQRDVFVPSRIKVGEGASAYYLDPTTDNSNWENCVSGIGTQDSTCVVPYRYGVAAGLATITADFTRANPVVGGAGTALRWTTTNAVSLNVTCTGVATYGPAAILLQGNPSGITLNSAAAGTVNCVYVARNSDNEPTTVTASVTFVNPVPLTLTSGFSVMNPLVGGAGTSPIWTSTGAEKVYVSGCTGLPSGAGWGPGYVPLQGVAGATVFKFGTTPGTVTCNYVATNELGQSVTSTSSVTFVMPPPPTVNIWFDPPAIREGESSTLRYSTGNAVYAGIMCSGVGFVSAGQVPAAFLNQQWYWFPITFSTQGVQRCGIHAYNQAGQLAWLDVDLYIHPISVAVPTSPPPSGGVVNWGSPGDGGGADGPGAGDSGCGTGADGASGASCSAE